MGLSIGRVGVTEERPPRVGARLTRLMAATALPLLVAAAYYAGSEVGFAIKFPSIPTSIVWPPNSLLMAALMLTPPRRWWAYLLAVLPAHLLIQSGAAVPLPAMLFLFMTNAGEAALGAYAVRRLCGGPPRFGYVRDVIVFCVFAVLAAPFVTSFPDAAAVVLTRWSDNYWLVWWARFLSNVLTVIMLVPAIVMWAVQGRGWLRAASPRRIAEAGLLALGLGVTYAFAYSESSFGPSFVPAKLYAPLPFLIWAALRFGAGGVCTSLLAVLLISVSYAIDGMGPFNSRSPAEDIVGLQLFLIAISVPMIVLASVTEERRRAAEALKESEARNRAILRAIPDIMFLQTPDGVYLDFHARDMKELYVPPAAFIGKNVRDVLHPELAERFLNSFRLAGELGEPQVVEYALTLEEQERHFEARIVRSNGHVLSVVRDLTERKRADAVVMERDQLLQAVFSSLSAHVVVLDRDGLITYASRSWTQFAAENQGQPESVSVGVNYLEVCRRAARAGDEKASEALQGLGAVMSREQPTFAIEYPCHAPDKRRWFLMHVDPMPAEHGGVVVSHIDITERKLAEATLKLQSRMLDTIEQAAIATDLHGVIFFWNQFAERLYGWSKEEAIGRRVSDLLSYADDEEMSVLAEGIWSELREGGSWVGEFTLRRRDGTTLQVWVNDSPIIDEKGNVVGIIGISHDITERKRAEKALRESEAELESDLADAKHLQKISSLLLHEDDDQELYGQILDAAIALLKSDAGSVQMLDRETGELCLLAWKGFDPESAKFWERVRPDSQSSCGVALGTGERVILPDVEACNFLVGTEDLASYRLSGLRAVQTTPLMSRGGRLLGMISTHWREVRGPSERELRLLDVIARQAADLLERKQAENALRESEKRFRTMADATPIMVWMSGTDKLCTYFNKGWLDFTGRTMEEELGNGWAEGVHPEDYDRCLEIYTTSFDARQPFSLEYRLRCHDGEYRWLFDTGVPLYSPGGAFLGYIGSCLDITERKQVETALRESESRLRLAQEAARVGTWEWDVTTGGAVWTEMLWRLLGLEPGEGAPTHERFMEFVHPEDRERARRKIREALAGGEEYENEFRIVRRDGEVLWLASKGRVIRSAEGRPERMLGVNMDITERKRAEEALRESEERFRNMANNASVVIWVTEPDNSCTFLSQTWQDLTGQAPEEGLGFGWAECVHPDDRARSLDTFRAANERREAFRLDYRLRGKDGAFLWAIDSGAPRFSSQGEFLGYTGSVIDITDRKRAEQSLEQLTGRLLQLQDEERRRIARELHDTTAQNLLAIVLNLETLVRMASALPKDFTDAVLECQSLCEQTQAELRTLSYLLHPPMLDEAGLPLAVEWFVEGFSRRSGIHVDFVAPPDFRRLPSRMETALFRVVQESLTNIYRHSGCTTAEMSLERAGGEVRLRVTDRGCGMTAASGEEAGNGAGPPDRRAETVGVGISGMRERLRQMGGHLEVRSDGAGTTVTAVLPLGKGEGE